jgi:RNA polymerase sigma factor (TIGR02999 family)
MPLPPDGEVTALLHAAAEGDAHAADALMHQVYDALRRIAHRQLRGERADHTLNTTALVHEAWMKLVRQDAGFSNRAHFLGVAALAMRRILVTYAKARLAAKRGGGVRAVTLEPGRVPDPNAPEGLLALDDALEGLLALDERMGKVVLYRFYAGLTEPEIADALDVSVPTVKRDWRRARAWLGAELRGDAS